MRRYAATLATLTFAVFGFVACGGDDAPPTGPIDFQVEHYDYSFDLESRAATTSLRVQVIEPGDCLSIPVRAGLVREVVIDAEPPEMVQFADGLLSVCGRGWEAGESFVLTANVVVPLTTWDDSQVGYSVSTDLEGAPFHYLVSWVGGCDRFGPCDSAPDRFATYTFRVTHPSGTQVVCPGTLNVGDTTTVCDFTSDGGPTYSTFGFAASPSWTVHELGTWGTVRATLYDMPSSGVVDDLDTDYHRDFLLWMEERFGPYPYGDELRFVIGPTFWSGFEHPGNIVLNDRLNGFGGSLAHTTNHEIAHMWAGNQTTLKDTYDFVWKEATVEYLTYVFEETELSAGMARSLANSWKIRARSADYYIVPDERPGLLEYYGDVYSSGPIILYRQIEALYGRDAVFEALVSLLGTPRAIGVSDVQAALEAATGADLNNYFDTWVHGSGVPVFPVFEVVVTDAGGGVVEVTVTQRDAQDGLFGTAFAVELTGDAEGDSYDVWFDLGPDGLATRTVSATPGFAVTGHVFDPHIHTLAIELGTSLARPVGFGPWRSIEVPVPYYPKSD